MKKTFIQVFSIIPISRLRDLKMKEKKQVRIQSPLNLEYLLLNEMNCGTNKDVVFLCSGGKKVGFVKSLLCSSFPLFHQILPSCESEKFLPKDSQIFVSMDEVESELLEEYLLTIKRQFLL